jgi:DNA polymerase I-like protein with 3'-5' exonuclease and polymerase domains
MDKVFLFADYSQAEARVVAWAGPIPAMRTWFQTGEDIHLNVARLIGRIVHENKIEMPHGLWRKSWTEIVKGDPERQLAKNTVHGNNYDMGALKFGLVTGLPHKYARIVQDMYHAIFPEIRGNYHKWIRDELNKNRTLTNPLGWKRTFYDAYGSELERAAYAWYPQSTIGLLTIRTLTHVCEVFKEDYSNAKILTPSRIRALGLDVQLQVHDSIGVVLPNDPTLVAAAARRIKEIAEYPLIIKGEPLVVPVDFKIGPTWGDQHDYHIPD